MKEEKIILEKKLNDFEDDIFEGKEIDVKSFYKLKKELFEEL